MILGFLGLVGIILFLFLFWSGLGEGQFNMFGLSHVRIVGYSFPPTWRVQQRQSPGLVDIPGSVRGGTACEEDSAPVQTESKK